MTQNKSTEPGRLLAEIEKALKSIDYGSVEIIVQDKTVTQITVRNIRKTSVTIQSESHINENVTQVTQFRS